MQINILWKKEWTNTKHVLQAKWGNHILSSLLVCFCNKIEINIFPGAHHLFPSTQCNMQHFFLIEKKKLPAAFLNKPKQKDILESIWICWESLGGPFVLQWKESGLSFSRWGSVRNSPSRCGTPWCAEFWHTATKSPQGGKIWDPSPRPLLPEIWSEGGPWGHLADSGQGCLADRTVLFQASRGQRLGGPWFSHPAGVELWAESQAHEGDLRKLRPWSSDEGQTRVISGEVHSILQILDLFSAATLGGSIRDKDVNGSLYLMAGVY